MKRNRGENVALVRPANYTKTYTDVDYSGTGALSWLPGIVETGLKYRIITDARTEFEATRNVTRAEAFGMVMTSVCMPIPDVSTDWQESVHSAAADNGLTVRTWSSFEPNTQILRQELYVIAARAADWAEKTGGCSPVANECLAK